MVKRSMRREAYALARQVAKGRHSCLSDTSSSNSQTTLVLQSAQNSDQALRTLCC